MFWTAFNPEVKKIQTNKSALQTAPGLLAFTHYSVPQHILTFICAVVLMPKSKFAQIPLLPDADLSLQELKSPIQMIHIYLLWPHRNA